MRHHHWSHSRHRCSGPGSLREERIKTARRARNITKPGDDETLLTSPQLWFVVTDELRYESDSSGLLQCTRCEAAPTRDIPYARRRSG